MLRAWHKPTDISPCYLIIAYPAGFYAGLGTTLFLFALDLILVCRTARWQQASVRCNSFSWRSLPCN